MLAYCGTCEEKDRRGGERMREDERGCECWVGRLTICDSMLNVGLGPPAWLLFGGVVRGLRALYSGSD